MRPHLLRVTAFGAFGGTEEVSFDDLAPSGLFLLHGETGAGKTTLLDAIGFALYGRVPGERGKARRLRSDHAAPATRTEVQLEATIGGRRIRVTRRPEQQRPKLRGDGITTEPAKVLLEEFGDQRGERGQAASWRALSTRAGEADQEIRDLMGMSAEQFFQVVLLPQGQFAQFLHAGAEQKQGLLEKLFGTDRFRAVEDWLAERRRTTARDVDLATRDVANLAARIAQVASVPPPDGTQEDSLWAERQAEAAAAAAGAAAATAASRRADLDAAAGAQRDAERLADRQRRRDGALRTRDELAAAEPGIAALRRERDAAARAAEVAAALAEAERTAAALAQAQAAEQQARAGARAHVGTAAAAPAARLRAAAEEYFAQEGRLDALRSLARQAADEDAAAAAARAAATALAAEICATREQAGTAGGQRRDLAAERDNAREAAQRLPSAQAEAGRLRRAADDAAAMIAARADMHRRQEAYLAAKLDFLRLREEAMRLREARIDSMRAELAAALVDGSPCPVCGALDHPEPCELRGERITREEEEAADAEAAAGSDRAETAGARLAAADALVAGLATRLDDAGFTAAADPATVGEEAARLDRTSRERHDDAARLGAAAAKLDDLTGALDALDQAIADADRCLAELAARREDALARAAEADQRAAGHRESLRAQLGGAPDLETALSGARDAAGALTAAAAAADAAGRAETDAARARDQAARAAATAGFAGLAAAREAQRDAEWRAAADQAIRDHDARSRAVAELLADPDLDVPLEVPADVAAATAAVDQARTAHDEAVLAHGRAQHRAAQLADLVPELGKLMHELKPLEAAAAEARAVADLAAGLGRNTLRMTLSSFVLAAKLEVVAAAATERLLRMTSGRYSLVHTDARRGAGRSGLGLLACDAWTGADRDTSTLSGGETFLASLALALGLADVVTAEAGGARIEALFVDEGFGSLDEDTLEEVMTVLDGLREGGRMVGLVSHVAELKQRIPAQVRVLKGRSGSRVQVLAPVA